MQGNIDKQKEMCTFADLDEMLISICSLNFVQGKRAELHLSKFGNGTNGKSIKYKGEWMTPEEYEQVWINFVF